MIAKTNSKEKQFKAVIYAQNQEIQRLRSENLSLKKQSKIDKQENQELKKEVSSLTQANEPKRGKKIKRQMSFVRDEFSNKFVIDTDPYEPQRKKSKTEGIQENTEAEGSSSIVF